MDSRLCNNLVQLLMNITISPVSPEDAEGVYAVFRNTWLDTYPSLEHNITTEDILSKYPEDKKEETLKSWRKFYSGITPDSYTQVWVAKNQDKVVGVMTIDKDTPIRIGALYVLPEFQGYGIGKMLMEQALAYIGHADAQLNVATYNARAIGFYEKYGFRVIGPIDDPYGVLPTGKRIPEVRMIRKSIKTI